MRLHRVRQSGDSGVSLAEVLVALFVISIVMTGAAAFFIQSLKVSGTQQQRQNSVVVANQAIEAVRAVKADRLLMGRSQAK